MKKPALHKNIIIWLFTLVAAFSSFHATANLLDVDDAFQLQPAKVEGDKIILQWKIADGYYLYQKRVSITSSDLTLGELSFPKAIIKDDPAFGRSEVFKKDLTVKQAFTGSAQTANLTVKYQGCEEKQGVCYPPQTRQISVDLGQATSGQAASNTMTGAPAGMAAFDSLSGLNQLLSDTSTPQLLPADEAFQLSTAPDKQGNLILSFKVAPSYHLYKDKIKIKLKQGQATIGQPQLPAAIPANDPVFGDVEVYKKDFNAKLPLSGVSSTAEIEIGYQGCSSESGVCYPPEHKKVTVHAADFSNIVITQPAAPAANDSANLSETDQITSTLQDSSVWIVIGTFFLFGLLLSLTPCVFPMIPILSSIIVGQGDQLTTRKAFMMSLVYVLAMSVTYTVAGVLAGVFGENLQVLFQNPWIIGSFAVIFVALAFSMFGFYELQLPSSLQSKITNLSNKQSGGTMTGVAIMGFLSALIVGPCVAPPLAGALIYIGQTGDALLGGTALFAMSMGMGVPLLLLGTSAGKLLPKAGAWMDNVKAIFGVLMLGVAIWMAERILPGSVTLFLWGALLIGSAIYLGALEAIGDKSGWHKLGKSIGVILLTLGILLMIGLAGGSKDVLQPLKVYQGGGSGSAAAEQKLAFQKIKTVDDLNAELAKGKPVMLDFYADWCISCKEMEAFTFSDPKVQQALSGVTLLKADVTANDAEDKALMKAFNIVGPPAIMFFKAGQEQKAQRVVGFKKAEPFIEHINASFK